MIQHLFQERAFVFFESDMYTSDLRHLRAHVPHLLQYSKLYDFVNRMHKYLFTYLKYAPGALRRCFPFLSFFFVAKPHVLQTCLCRCQDNDFCQGYGAFQFTVMY